jgi:tryptophan synthase alpha chain
MTVSNALDEAFARARQDDRAVLIPYITAGFPDPERFVDLAVAVLEAGADALEIGIPFSDPLLDGPAIQHSQQKALDAGVTPPRCLEYAAAIHTRSDKPLLFFGAYNPVFAYGPARFCRDAAQAGISGLIFPDVPVEEQQELREAATGHGIHLIQLVAPTSTPERLARVCAAASGFVYCISVAGVTGVRSGVAEAARPLVEKIRACTDVPVAVGFGIAGPEQAQQVAAFADGAIVGSALINLLAETPLDARVERAAAFVQQLSQALLPHSARLSQMK